MWWLAFYLAVLFGLICLVSEWHRLKALSNYLTGWPQPAEPEGITVDEGAVHDASMAMGTEITSSLSAVVIRACRICQAPGRYLSEQRIKEGWPGCYVEPSDPRDGTPVGSVCPNCKEKRPGDEDLGKIWEGKGRLLP